MYPHGVEVGVKRVEGSGQGLTGEKPASLFMSLLPLISSTRVPRVVADSGPATQGGDQQLDMEKRRRGNL